MMHKRVVFSIFQRSHTAKPKERECNAKRLLFYTTPRSLFPSDLPFTSPMADSDSCFSPLSSDAHSDVENLLAQAADLHALEQIAALNTCHLPDTTLPSHLESRFLRLKSLPTPLSPAVHGDAEGDDIGRRHSFGSEEVKVAVMDSPAPPVSSKMDDKYRYSFSASGASSPAVLSPPPRSSRRDWWMGRFWCFPTRSCKKKDVEDCEQDLALDLDHDLGYWAMGGHIMSGFDQLSVEDQRRRLKMVMKEVEKSKREAKNIIKSVLREYK